MTATDKRAPASGAPSLADRIGNEIRQFTNRAQARPLPEIFHFWSNQLMTPRVKTVFSSFKPGQIFNSILIEALDAPGAPRRLISLGSGACRMELKLVAALIEAGQRDFVLECVDLTGSRVEIARRAAAEAGLADYFVFTETDVNQWRPQRKYAAVIAAQSLHHFVELEHVFQAIKDALDEHGVFVTSDMIGRNGHQRWPEALVAINAIWETLPERCRYNHSFKCQENVYVNRDFSGKGFEGIRAQDIMPLLHEYFHFRKFVAFGNVIDPFISRAFGPNFSKEDENDREFIRKVDALNGHLIDDGLVKPTQMRAVLSTTPVAATAVYRHWTPAFCTRRPDFDPSAHHDHILACVREMK